MTAVDNIVILASDHNGINLKSYLVSFLKQAGYVPIDLGPHSNTISVDYVDYAKQVANIIQSNGDFKGVLICGTGVGMSIVANRFANVRAALVHNLETATKSREHNDSNVLCLGNWINELDISKEILRLWLQEPYGEGRHNRRLSKIPDATPHKIVFTNGVFDILHTGHLELLRFSKRLGDKLVVAIDNDTSVRILKGKDRPVNSEEDRKKILESLREVDQVIIFDGNLEAVRRQVAPHIVVKGGEWTPEQVRKRDNIEDQIAVKIFPFVDNYSTTNVMRRIRSLDSCEKNEFSK